MEETKELEPYGVIYYVLNTRNGKCYVGQTIQTLEKRWRGHVFDSRYSFSKKGCRNNYFYRAIRKYGKHFFEARNLLTVYSKEDLDSAETYYIDFFQSRNPKIGYNSKTGGANGRPNEYTRSLQSQAKKGKPGVPRTPEWTEKIAVSLRGKKQTDEAKANMSAAHLGVKLSPEHIAARVSGQTGTKRTPEQRANMSAAQSRRLPPSEETKARQSQAKKGRKIPEQAKENMKTAQRERREKEKQGPPLHIKGHPVSEKTRNRLREVNTGKKHTEESKERMRQSANLRWEREKTEKLAPSETGA